MSLNQENIAVGWSVFLGTGVTLPIVIFYKLFLSRSPATKRHEVILITFISLASIAINLELFPDTLKRTVAEYQFRYQDGPDPETIFHDIEAEANYVPSHSKFDSFARALGGESKKRRRPRGAPSPTPTPTPSNAAAMTQSAVNSAG